ncbi:MULTISPECIES: hypothetical protein [Corallococcus]|uniref:hypothetical protein n=1 Tax=Corallococcus TaxID=83461 RepID=UPI00117F8A3A|nr:MULTISPECIES: hypothetical protein [Corallococcus]NBD07600.1 hypothetical protein [Corallococcus silvisoli]TSC33605.1 hypothetical protein FOF48_00675 [Corallococcus sp. Z5C101001]
MNRAMESRRTQDEGQQAFPLEDAARGDVSMARWEAQPWRRQLQVPRAHEQRVARGALVDALLSEGCSVEADVARFAGAMEDRASISIGQVVRFADGLRLRLTQARSDDEVLQLAYLRRNAEELAERMIDWANTGRLPA